MYKPKSNYNKNTQHNQYIEPRYTAPLKNDGSNIIL